MSLPTERGHGDAGRLWDFTSVVGLSPVMCMQVGEEFIGGDVHCASEIMGKLQPQCQVYLGQFPFCKDEKTAGIRGLAKLNGY